MAVITPPAIATAAGATPAGVTTRVLRITRSARGMPGRRYVPRRTRRQGRSSPYASVWILPQRPPHQHGDVVRPSGVEGIAQQVLADLLLRRHREEALADPTVGNVLREAVAAQQADVAPLLLHVRDD